MRPPMRTVECAVSSSSGSFSSRSRRTAGLRSQYSSMWASTWTPSGKDTVWMRPPGRGAASSRRTSMPALRSSYAVVRPVRPAPTMTTGASARGGTSGRGGPEGRAVWQPRRTANPRATDTARNRNRSIKGFLHAARAPMLSRRVESRPCCWRRGVPKVLLPFALHGLAREVDGAVGTLLHTSLDLPDFVAHAVSLLDPRQVFLSVLAWSAAGAGRLVPSRPAPRAARFESVWPPPSRPRPPGFGPLYLRPAS